MTDQHPITPPPELVQQCWDELRDQTQVLDAAKAWDKAIALAYRAGADLLQRQHPQPVAVGLTDEELLEAFDGEFAEFFDSSDGFGTTAISRSEWTKVAHAVLARWGRPTPQPVAVSERLPGPEDCDEQGRCWLLTVEDEYPQWRLHSIEGAQPGGAMIWVPVDSSPGVMVDCFYTSHWLPANALPTPAQ